MLEYNQSPPKVRFITPPNHLKNKVGHGGIDKSLIDKAQKAIDECEIDISDMTRELIKEIGTHIENYSAENQNETREKLIEPIMQLKANGGMFQYHLLSDVANIALQFLEAIDELNTDGLAVIKAHERSLDGIVSNNLKGYGGKEGDALISELDKACRRYFGKHGAPE